MNDSVCTLAVFSETFDVGMSCVTGKASDLFACVTFWTTRLKLCAVADTKSTKTKCRMYMLQAKWFCKVSKVFCFENWIDE